MKKRFNHKVILLSILILAVLLRFYNLGSYPALNADEASLGYDAYSLLKTGMDQHGNHWPLQFQSFNDYKPGLTVYLIMPFIAAFGLNEWSVRIFPAFIGVLGVLMMYLLVRELFDREYKEKASTFALIASFFLAISPWQIHFSRGAWEVNIATFLVTSGLYFFLKFTKKPHYIFASVLCFALALYTYHAARIITPLLLVGLLAFFYIEIWKFKKYVIFAGVFGLILSIPLLLSLKGPAGLARADGVAIWADIGPVNRVNQLRGDYSNPNSMVAKVLHNRPIVYTLDFLQNWTTHYWGEFLFLSGDVIQRNRVPETGQLYLVELLFIGISVVAISKKVNQGWKVVLWWLIIAPVPAALTFQSPHALRAENMIIPLEIISAFGFLQICQYFEKYKKGKYFALSKVIVGIIMVWSLSRYIHMYYVHMTKEYPFSSQDGVKELVNYVGPIHGSYKNVVITDRYDQPYILFLFYLKYDPAVFQKEHTLTSPDGFGFSTVRSFSNFKFESIDFNKSAEQYPNSLLVGTEEEIPNESNIMKDIYGSNSYKYFRVVVN